MLKKILKITLNVILVILLILSLLILSYSIYGKISGKSNIFGLQLYNIVTGSMEPNIRIKDVVVAVETPFEELEEEDVIVFRRGNMIVTHRIKGFEGDNIVTKGDNNPDEDEARVAFEDVLGKMIFVIPFLGYVTNFLNTGIGFFLVIFVPLASILVYEIFSFTKKYRKYKIEEKQEELAELQKQLSEKNSNKE